LPTGRSLDASLWERHHRINTWMLGLLVLAVPIISAASGLGPAPVAGEALMLAALLVIALDGRVSRTVRMVDVSLGLMVASAMTVYAAHGATEAHFMFFVLLPLTVLYGAWLPFAVAIAFVAMHHFVLGLLDPGAVFRLVNRPSGWRRFTPR
jgi:hypothetical protein